MDRMVETLVIGGGQAGVAMSEHLGRRGISHVVLERGRIAERWRSERWDSLVTNGPAWHDRFPGMAFPQGPEAFVPKEGVAQYFTDYAQMLGAPIRTGVEVLSCTRKPGARGFVLDTTDGRFEANSIVSATGPFQVPVIPPLIAPETPVHQLHSNAYKSPRQLPEGAVLVVGAGSSGVQIAEELLASGRRVFLSVGAHDRPPRRYRGRDFVWWLGVLGLWDAAAMTPGKEHVTIAVSGAHGGKTIDFRELAARGMTLLGMTRAHEARDATGHDTPCDAGCVTFAPDLAANIRAGDANYLGLLDMADAYVAANGLDLPEDPQARALLPDPPCMTDPITRLDLQAEGITTVLWATGYRQEYPWLKVEGALTEAGTPAQHRGVSPAQGVYFLGLPWLSRRGSTFIWGVWHDASHIADQIAIQMSYARYEAPEADSETDAQAVLKGPADVS